MPAPCVRASSISRLQHLQELFFELKGQRTLGPGLGLVWCNLYSVCLPITLSFRFGWQTETEPITIFIFFIFFFIFFPTNRARLAEELLCSARWRLPSSKMARHVQRSSTTLASNAPILTWWKEHAARFPYLSQLARRYLAMPATSVGRETIFCSWSDSHSQEGESTPRHRHTTCVFT